MKACAVFALLAVVSACPGAPLEPDAGTEDDAGILDAGVVDGGVAESDAGPDEEACRCFVRGRDFSFPAACREQPMECGDGCRCCDELDEGVIEPALLVGNTELAEHYANPLPLGCPTRAVDIQSVSDFLPLTGLALHYGEVRLRRIEAPNLQIAGDAFIASSIVMDDVSGPTELSFPRITHIRFVQIGFFDTISTLTRISFPNLDARSQPSIVLSGDLSNLCVLDIGSACVPIDDRTFEGGLCDGGTFELISGC